MNNYDDIIEIDYEKIKSKRHPQMSRLQRAAQFAPFAALTGHEEAIEETGNAHTVDETVRETFYEES
ncbi:MAG: hypothetical protein Q4D29_01560 [Lachnospiraceae bacterium]|nr:hypothetical protein [Lachnospiraceae bacterium]